MVFKKNRKTLWYSYPRRWSLFKNHKKS